MAEQEETKPSGPGLMGLVRGAAIVGVLVLVELVAAAFLIPSAEDTERLAQELARASSGEDYIAEQDGEAVDERRDETKEVEIGTFNITRFDPEADKTLNIDFSVYGVVLLEDESLFLEEFEANQNRIHEQIVMTMHSAKTSDLTNAGLGLIKRQILEKTNRTLGKPLLREVVFTRINFVER